MNLTSRVRFVLRKSVAILLAIMTVFVYMGLHAPKVAAENVSTSAVVNTFVTAGQTIKASSASTAVLGLNLADATTPTVNEVKVTIAGPAGFDPNVDLAALGNATSSGVSLWSDGAVATEDGVFNAAGGNGDGVVTLSSATYNVPTSTRVSQLTPLGGGVFVVASTNAIVPPGSYAAPAVGDIVLYQSSTNAPVWGVVTNATLTSGTFAINGAAVASGTYVISKFGGGADNTSSFTTGSAGGNPWTGVTGTTTPPATGDIVLLQTGTNAATWNVVTAGGSQNQNVLKLNGAVLNATTAYVMTKISAFSSATSAVDGATPGKLTQGLNFALGDLVLATTGSGYVWGVVTTAENVAAGGTATALRINDAAATSLFSTASQVSKITPSGTAFATAGTPTLAAGNAVFGNVALYAANATLNGYNWHTVTVGGTGGAAIALRLDGASAAPFWPWVATLTPAVAPAILADNTTAGNVGSDFYLVVKTSAIPVNNHQFLVQITNNADVTLSAKTVSFSPPVVTAPLTIDTVAPTINTSYSGPTGTNVPISAFINVNFSENIDSTTINNSNVTLTASGTPVGIGFRTMPNGFSVVVSDKPTYTTGTRFAKVANTAFGFFMISSGSITPMGSYAVPATGDIVYYQHDTFPAEWGIITNATLTAGTFAVNNFMLFGGQQMTKFASAATTTAAVTDPTALNKGDIVMANTTANPTGDRYAWHIVTSADAVAVNHANFRLDNASTTPTFFSGSNLSAIAPAATATDNGATGGGTLAVNQGDLVFAKLAGSSYGWHIATTAGDLSSTSTEATAILDNLANAAASQVAANSQMSKIVPSTQGPVTDTATALSMGDILFAKTTANAANNNAYNFHVVSSGATGVSNVNLRLDNTSSNLAISTPYVLTVGTGVKDSAGNGLASQQTISFTTGSTGGTNITPPFVQSTIPGPGNQTFPITGKIKITFSVDMATSGAGSATSTSNIGLFTDNFGLPGSLVAATLSYDSASRTVTLTPSSLSASTGYVVKVANATQSSTGATMPQEFLQYFRTASASDTAASGAPTVTGTNPSNNATGVSRSTAINVGFNKDMDPATLTTATFTLKTTSGAVPVVGSVVYNPSSRSVSFAPTTQLSGSTSYTLTLLTGVLDSAGTALASNYTAVFTTDNTTDDVKPFVSFATADNFNVAITFSEQVKSGSGPAAADSIANYSLESPVGSSISLSGKSVVYEGASKTAKISGLSLQNGNTFKVTVSTMVQDLANNVMDTDTSGGPAKNTSFGTVQNSTITGGQLGPGYGPAPDPGMQGMNPIRVMAMTRAAGATSSYKIEFPVTSSTPITGQIILTFPTGFNVANAAAVAAGTASFCNSDLNGSMTGTVTIASVANDNAAGTITITTAGAATGNNVFLCLDLSGIVNSTIPSSSGYTVDIKTKDTALNNRMILESKTSAPFFLGQAGSRTLTVNVFNDNGLTEGIANNNIKDGAEAGIADVTVFLFSPASGGQNATTSASGVASFANLADGDYQIGLDPSTLAGGGFVFNSAQQAFMVSASNTTKNFGLSHSALTISGSITGPASTALDVFANSPSGYTSTTVTTDGTTGVASYTLPAQANTTYNVGIGPAIPKTFQQPGSPPPPPPTFNFMPPPPSEVVVAAVSATKNFTLTATDRTVTGTVKDSGNNGVSNAGVFCRPPATSTTGVASGFGTGGQTDTSGAFSLRVTDGVYLCGVNKPGMPPVPDKQIVVAAGGNSPTALNFVLDVATTLSISGTIKDDSGNAIPYAGVSGRKVVSTTDTNVMGGDPSNFVGGPTDANGGYTLYVTQGTWVVEAFAPGFGRLGTKTISVGSSNATGQDFSAQNLSFGTITGTVKSGAGDTPVQGAMVRGENTSSSNGNMTSTATDGTYSLKVSFGTYTVYAFVPGVGEATPLTNIAVNSTGTPVSGKNFTIGTPITITVNVTDGSSHPITNAGVDVRDSNGRGNFTQDSVSSGANAVYTISVPPGTYNVRVSHPAYGPITTCPTAAALTGVNTARTITCTASAGQTFAVTGTIKVGASALSGAWVSLIGSPTGQTNSIFLGGQSDASGNFSISVPAGSYRLRVDKPGYRSPAEQIVAVTAAKAVGDIVVTTAGRTISGTVTLSGSAVSNAFVDATDGAGGYAVSQTDVSGAYSLAVDNGTWTLRAHSPGYEGGPFPVTVNNNSPGAQTITLAAMSGFTVKPEKPETITPNSGGFLTNSDIGNNFKLNIPANALGTGSNSATVTTKVNTAMPNPPSGAILSKNAVTISAVGSDGSKISSLNDSITIVVPYDEANLPSGAQETNLVLGSWNDATQSYDTLSTTVDIVNDTLTATVSHLSDFAPMVPSSESAPATPTGLTLTNQGNGNAVVVRWSSVSGASTYNIYRSTDNASFPLVYSTSSITYADNALAAGTTYYYKVSAVNAAGAESAATLLAVSITPQNTVGPSGGGGGGGGAYVAPAPAPATTTPATLLPTPAAPTSTPASNLSAPSVSASAGHPNGTLILDGKTVYLIKNGQKVGFRDSSEYKSHGYNFGQAVAANAQDKALPQAEFVQKALEGTLVLDAADNKTVYMIGTGNTKRGFVSAQVFKALGYSFANLPKINLTDYPSGPVISTSSDPHPDGALVLEGKTVWWLQNGQRLGFESMAVFNTYGFSVSKIVKSNTADLSLPQGPLVKFRDGTLVKDGSSYYLVSDGQAWPFATSGALTSQGFKTSNAISGSVKNYPLGNIIQAPD